MAAAKSRPNLFQLTAARRRLVGVVAAFLRQALFQLTAARRRLGTWKTMRRTLCARFQLTAARRRLALLANRPPVTCGFQLTAARRRLVVFIDWFGFRICFNSQPPEGGWDMLRKHEGFSEGFNSQPPEGGWLLCLLQKLIQNRFQLTAARRRLGRPFFKHAAPSRFNSQPPEGGWRIVPFNHRFAAAFQLTAARRRLVVTKSCLSLSQTFQLTAARRRLDI